MHRRQLLAVAAAGLAASTASAKSKVRDRFLGVWKLVACESKTGDGQITYPYGEKPVGRITYDSASRMSAILMRPGRKSTLASGVTLSIGNAGVEEIREAVNGFTAYYGTFDIDEAKTTVIHHVEAALVPSWVGTDLKRTYAFSGNRLTLTATGARTTVLVWEREPAPTSR